MGQDSKIEWTHHTFNPWRGCTKVSAGCDNCYAEAMSHRNPGVLGVWGDDGTRVVASEAMWREPFRWNREAMGRGQRARVFCASLADVWERRPDVAASRARLLAVIHQTSWLDWLLLTKRPEHIDACLRDCASRRVDIPSSLALQWMHGDILPNIWLGTSVEDQAAAEQRIPALLTHASRIKFLSLEPLLGRLDLRRWLGPDKINWAIVGGESGHGARSFDVEWCEDIVQQCREAKIAVFVKQLGARPMADGQLIQLRNKKGGDIADFPEHLQIREFPTQR